MLHRHLQLRGNALCAGCTRQNTDTAGVDDKEFGARRRRRDEQVVYMRVAKPIPDDHDPGGLLGQTPRLAALSFIQASSPSGPRRTGTALFDGDILRSM